MSFGDYAGAIAALENLIARPPLAKEQAGLLRVERLLREVGDPHLSFPAIHITGSAGKGSTAAMAACILRQAGHRTATFTSPHLVSYTERIAVDGQPIAPALWVDYQARVWPIVERMATDCLPGYGLGRPIFLEVLWAMACLYFRDRGVACAVVEVGMGGRHDATTANAASVGVITNVSLEHTAKLGPTLEDIAAQKAGIVKPGMVVITAAGPPAGEIVAAAARRQDATLWRVARSGEGAAEVSYEDDGHALTITTPRQVYRGLRPGLRGPHQALNAACAVAAVDAFAPREGLALGADDVREGLAAARLPGRLEFLPGQPDVLLDGAQTAVGVQALAAGIAALYPARPLTLLVAIVSDKDLVPRVSVLSALLRPTARTGEPLPPAGLMVVTEPPWAERGGTAAAIAELARAVGIRVAVEPDHSRALEMARAATPPGGLLVVAGSLFLVGAVRALLRPDPADPEPGRVGP